MSYFKKRLEEINGTAGLIATPPRSRRRVAEPERPLVGTKLGYIYFITEGGCEAEAVKIGFASDVSGRLHNLGTGNFRKLTVQTAFRSYIEAERMLHQRFKADRINREWFNLTEDIEEFWDDILDYQGCHGNTSGTGEEFLSSMDEAIFELEDLKLMLANIGTPWQVLRRPAAA
jgi:hypothetical protein